MLRFGRTIVFCFLCLVPNLLKIFVQNRVAEIHELTTECTWRHVRGKDNIADFISRSVSLEDVLSWYLWWKGLSFLQDAVLNNQYNSVTKNYILTIHLHELKSNFINLLITNIGDNNAHESFFLFNSVCRFGRMFCVVIDVFRFINNVSICDKSRQATGVITIFELRQANNKLPRLSQMESFKHEYDT